MAGGWMKSLQCKSRGHEDAVDPKNFNHLMATTSCRKSYQNLKDVIETTKQQHKPRKSTSSSSSKKQISSSSSRHHHPRMFVPDPNPIFPNRVRVRISQDSVFPTLAELPEGHPSRNVVEIIFHTSWGSKAFSGRVEMIFKVQNLGRTAARFEEYREVVKGRAGSGCEDDARCVADGNEVMRFHCLGATSAEAGRGGAWAFPGGKGKPVCTFAGSGAAHERAGGGRGRRAMLVCRVIAGRVGKKIGLESLLEGRVGYDSVSGENGELLVFDSRAVLPCFLIIYKL